MEVKLKMINDKPRNDELSNIKIWKEYISSNKPTTTCMVKYDPYKNDDNIPIPVAVVLNSSCNGVAIGPIELR